MIDGEWLELLMESKEPGLATIREEVDEDKLDYATLAKLGGRKG